MEYSTFTRATTLALCCLASGGALLLLAMGGVAPSAASIFGFLLVLVSVGIPVWIAVQLWAAMRGETVAYRVLYHADEPPDGKAIAAMLGALARNAGHVSLIWRFHSLPNGLGEATEAEAEAAVRLTCDQPKPDLGNASPRDPGRTLLSNVSLYIVAPAAARKALEGIIPGLLPGVWAERCKEPGPLRSDLSGQRVRAWRWPIQPASCGTLADPFACGVHLGELAARLQSAAGPSTEPGDIEIRLKLWLQGSSAVVAGQYGPPLAPLQRATPTCAEPTDRLTALEPGEATAWCDSQVSFLKPLVGDWLRRWSPSPCQRKRIGQARCKKPNAQSPGAGRGATSTLADTAGRLLVVLAARYPLWERLDASTSRFGVRFRSPERSRQTAPTGSGSAPSSPCLRFPSTTGPCLSLDSLQAGEVSPPPAYHLPPVASQLFVLGRATGDGRAIGIPALQRVPDAPLNPPQSASISSTGSGEMEPRAQVVSRLLARGLQKQSMRLHPMLAQQVLVAGGSDAWRRDVAGSLVSQASEMGMAVVAIDGGSPPDEPAASARKGSRIVSAQVRGHTSGLRSTGFAGSAGNYGRSTGADPLSPADLRLCAARGARWEAQIDMDNPAGSVRPNILYVPAPHWLPAMEGEALAASLALRTGLPAQMRFMQAVNVAGMDSGTLGLSAGEEPHFPEAGPGMALVEAWLTVLLLRHHRARLLLASRGIALPPDEAGLPASSGTSHPAHSGSSTTRLLPACPDLPALALVLEQTETLLSLLQRERDAWADPDWLSLVQTKGGEAGEGAVQAVAEALERLAPIEIMDQSDLFLYGAAVRGQLARVLGHPGLMRMLRGPHTSLAALLHGGITRMLSVNLSGAYRTAALPYSEDDLARKQYGLYLLWSLWAASRQRQALYAHQADGGMQTEPHPALLLLHGAGAWFGSGSPLSQRTKLLDFSAEGSGIAVAATVSGLRHLRAYRAGACEVFGNLVLGPAPVTELDAPDVIINLVGSEERLLRDATQDIADLSDAAGPDAILDRADVSQTGKARQATDSDHLFGVLRRIEDGTALVVTGAPGGARAACTAHVGSLAANDVRSSWRVASDEGGMQGKTVAAVGDPLGVE